MPKKEKTKIENNCGTFNKTEIGHSFNFYSKQSYQRSNICMYDHNKICVEPFNHAQHDDRSSTGKLKTFTNRIFGWHGPLQLLLNALNCFHKFNYTLQKTM